MPFDFTGMLEDYPDTSRFSSNFGRLGQSQNRPVLLPGTMPGGAGTFPPITIGPGQPTFPPVDLNAPIELPRPRPEPREPAVIPQIDPEQVRRQFETPFDFSGMLPSEEGPKPKLLPVHKTEQEKIMAPFDWVQRNILHNYTPSARGMSPSDMFTSWLPKLPEGVMQDVFYRTLGSLYGEPATLAAKPLGDITEGVYENVVRPFGSPGAVLTAPMLGGLSGTSKPIMRATGRIMAPMGAYSAGRIPYDIFWSDPNKSLKEVSGDVASDVMGAMFLPFGVGLTQAGKALPYAEQLATEARGINASRRAANISRLSSRELPAGLTPAAQEVAATMERLPDISPTITGEVPKVRVPEMLYSYDAQGQPIMLRASEFVDEKKAGDLIDQITHIGETLDRVSPKSAETLQTRRIKAIEELGKLEKKGGPGGGIPPVEPPVEPTALPEAWKPLAEELPSITGKPLFVEGTRGQGNIEAANFANPERAQQLIDRINTLSAGNLSDEAVLERAQAIQDLSQLPTVKSPVATRRGPLLPDKPEELQGLLVDAQESLSTIQRSNPNAKHLIKTVNERIDSIKEKIRQVGGSVASDTGIRSEAVVSEPLSLTERMAAATTEAEDTGRISMTADRVREKFKMPVHQALDEGVIVDDLKGGFKVNTGGRVMDRAPRGTTEPTTPAGMFDDALSRERAEVLPQPAAEVSLQRGGSLFDDALSRERMAAESGSPTLAQDIPKTEGTKPLFDDALAKELAGTGGGPPELPPGGNVPPGEEGPRPLFPESEVGPNRRERFGDWWEKNYDAPFAELNNLMRGMMSTADLSAPLRQGLTMVHRKEFYQSLWEMLKVAKSRPSSGLYEANQAALQAMPRFAEAKNVGLSVADAIGKEELGFASKIIDKIPGLRSVTKWSNNAYTTFLRNLRMRTYTNMMNQAETMAREGRMGDVIDEKFQKELAKYINNATGRGTFGNKGEGASQLLQSVFFSPRLLTSRLRTLTAPVSPKILTATPAYIRNQYFKSLGALGAFSVGALELANLAGAEIEKDPTSADFGKIRIGNTRVDVTGGHAAYIRLAAQAYHNGRKVGKVFKPFGEHYGAATLKDAFYDFFERKESPLMSLAAAWATQKDWRGDPINLAKFKYGLPRREQVDLSKFFLESELGQRLWPLGAQDTLKNLQNDPDLLKALAKALPAFFGATTQTYEDKPPKRYF